MLSPSRLFPFSCIRGGSSCYLMVGAAGDELRPFTEMGFTEWLRLLHDFQMTDKAPSYLSVSVVSHRLPHICTAARRRPSPSSPTLRRPAYTYTSSPLPSARTLRRSRPTSALRCRGCGAPPHSMHMHTYAHPCRRRAVYCPQASAPCHAQAVASAHRGAVSSTRSSRTRARASRSWGLRTFSRH